MDTSFVLPATVILWAIATLLFIIENSKNKNK